MSDEMEEAVTAAKRYLTNYEGIDPKLWGNLAKISTALIAAHAQIERMTYALTVIAAGSPMPESWGEQARGIDAYHRAVAQSTLDETTAQPAARLP